MTKAQLITDMKTNYMVSKVLKETLIETKPDGAKVYALHCLMQAGNVYGYQDILIRIEAEGTKDEVAGYFLQPPAKNLQTETERKSQAIAG